MFKIINYSTFNTIIEKKRTSKFTTTAITTIQYTTRGKNPDRKQMRLKSIGRAQINWSILINPMECIHSFEKRRATMASSSIFQFQWIVYSIFFLTLSSAYLAFFRVFISTFFHPLCTFFAGVHMVLSVFIFISFIWWRSIPDDWVGCFFSVSWVCVCVCVAKKESICNNKMTIDLMGNDDSNAETL